VELPEQMLAFVTPSVGVATTVMVIVRSWLGQMPLNPVMLYAVVVTGFSVCVAPERVPGFHE
jgi:hypothetical protein